MLSRYVPDFTIIVSPGDELLTAACIEPPGATALCVAVTIPDTDIKIKKANNKANCFLILIPPFS